MRLTSLINEIVAAEPVTCILVFDDFHVISTPQISKDITFLLDHLPPQMHLILSTRADPPWPLARLRARGEMIELRTEDLRFTRDEAAAFLNAAMGLRLTQEEVAALDAHTEGWIAGLQMAALSMKGRDTRAFIQAFGGSHRFVLDFLVEEVLDRQPDGVREFLLKTSVLDRLTASLCDAVMGKEGLDSREVLTHLERANLFLIPLDDERHWYRYHHLFADLLASRLSQRYSDQAPLLHRRASEWYERHELVAEAVSHALRAGDIERVTLLVKENVPAMMEHGELPTLATWLNVLPKHVVQAEPWLCVAQATFLRSTGQLDAVEPVLQDAEKAIAVSVPSSESQRIMGHILSARAGTAFVGGDMAQATRLSREALDLLPAGDVMMRGWTMAHLGTALGWSGDLVGAQAAFSKAATISQARGYAFVSVMALCSVAVVQMDRGLLRKAADTFSETMRLASAYVEQSGYQLPVLGYAHIYRAGILREWNELESALSQVKRGTMLCERWGEPQVLTSGYVRLARVFRSMGDLDSARKSIQEAKRVADGVSPWYADRVAADQVHLLLALGEVEAASQIAAAWESQVYAGADAAHRPVQHRDRSRALHLEEHGAHPHRTHLCQAGCPQPRGRSSARAGVGPALVPRVGPSLLKKAN